MAATGPSYTRTAIRLWQARTGTETRGRSIIAGHALSASDFSPTTISTIIHSLGGGTGARFPRSDAAHIMAAWARKEGRKGGREKRP
jgi:hypothetical protein